MLDMKSLTKDVYEFIARGSEQGYVVTRVDLNSRFKASFDLKSKSRLNDVLISLVCHNHVLRSRNDETGTISFWIDRHLPHLKEQHLPYPIDDLGISLIPDLLETDFPRQLPTSPTLPTPTPPSEPLVQPETELSMIDLIISLVEKAGRVMTVGEITEEVNKQAKKSWTINIIAMKCKLLSNQKRIFAVWRKISRSKTVFDYCSLKLSHELTLEELPKQEIRPKVDRPRTVERTSVSMRPAGVHGNPIQKVIDHERGITQSVEVRASHIILFSSYGQEVKLSAKDIQLVSLFREYFKV